MNLIIEENIILLVGIHSLSPLIASILPSMILLFWILSKRPVLKNWNPEPFTFGIRHIILSLMTVFISEVEFRECFRFKCRHELQEGIDRLSSYAFND